MTAVLQTLASAFGKDTTTSSDLDQDNHKTPAQQIKEKAIEEERKEVADGSSNGDDITTNDEKANGISTNPEEAHASDSVIKDNMSSKTDTATTNTTTTTNGADDNASMIPLGKGGDGQTVPPMGTTGNTTTTGNATPITTDNIDDITTNTTSAEGPTGVDSIIAMEAASISVTRAEIDSAKEAIIHAVANCKLTREVVFSDTDNSTEDGSAEVKRVLSGYKGIDQALAEMNRYIPVHVRDSHDLGVKEGERIQKEQQIAADALTADLKTDSANNLKTGYTSTTTTSGIANPDEKITEEQALAEAPSTSTTRDATTISAPSSNDNTSAGEGLTSLQKEELNRVPDVDASSTAAATTGTPGTTADKHANESPAPEGTQPEPEKGITLGAGVLPGAGAAAGATIPLEHIEDGKPAEIINEDRPVESTAVTSLESDSADKEVPSTTSADQDIPSSNTTEKAGDTTNDTSALGLASSATSDKGKGRAIGDDETTEAASPSAPATSPPTSPVHGEKLSDRLKREVEERARKGQLGVFNKPLGTSASTASFTAASKEPADTSAANQTSKDAPASSAFTEEFGPGETGLSTSSPTAATGAGTTSSSTKPPSTRARTASLSSQTSTGEKRGLLGLFRRRSKRQSVSDGSAAGRRASQDMGRTVSRDTTSSPVTASAVPPAPEKPVETIDTTATTDTPAPEAAKDESGKTAGLAALGVGAGTAAVASSSEPEKAAEDETVVADKSTTTAEPSTSEHKVEDVTAPANDMSTQTTHEPAPAIGTAAEPVTYVEETAPSTNAVDASEALPRKESPEDMIGPGALAAIAASHEEKEEPIHIEKEDEGDMIGPGALAKTLGETTSETTSKDPATESKVATVPAVSETAKPATAEKSTSTSVEKGTSTEEDKPATVESTTPAVAAAPVAHTDDDVPMYSKPSLDRNGPPTLERKNSKGGFFGLFRRRSSRRSSSGPPQRSVSDVSKPVPIESNTSTPVEHDLTPVVAAEASSLKEQEPLTEHEATTAPEVETPFVDATDAEDPSSDAAEAGLTRSDTDKEIAAEAEHYSEATIHAYGALNVDELETVEEEMERGPEETVAEPEGSVVDHEEDEERDLHDPDEIVSEPSQPIAASESGALAAPSQHATEHDAREERVASPVVASTPAERLLSGERRKSRSGGFFGGLFRSRTRKDKDRLSSDSTTYNNKSPYEDVVRNVGRVDLPSETRQPKETRDVGTAMSIAGTARSPSAARTRSVTSPAPGDESIIDHGTTHGEHADEEEEEYEESVYEEPIPDNRSITEIAASIPLPAPVYTDKTRAKHERLRKKREHEEAVERERVRKENEILAKRERIMTAYTGKQDFTKVPKPARTKAFGRAHERKDLDGVQYVNKSDKKAAKKDDLARTTSRGSSVHEPSSPSHPASGGLVGSFPADKSYTRVSQNTAVTSDFDTEPGSPSSPTSPIIKLGRRVSALAHKREKSVEVTAA